MSTRSSDAVWSLVMFDLPVQTKAERRRATAFRELLLDLGYQRTQLSVYSRFSPTVASILPVVRRIKAGLPDGGEVRILTITDHEWATALRFSNAKSVDADAAPTQLTIL